VSPEAVLAQLTRLVDELSPDAAARAVVAVSASEGDDIDALVTAACKQAGVEPAKAFVIVTRALDGDPLPVSDYVAPEHAAASGRGPRAPGAREIRSISAWCRAPE
jgi:hypothetical protein